MSTQRNRIVALALAGVSTVAVAQSRKSTPATPPLTLRVAAITMANTAVVKTNGQRYSCKQKSGCTFTSTSGTTIVFQPAQ